MWFPWRTAHSRSCPIHSRRTTDSEATQMQMASRPTTLDRRLGLPDRRRNLEDRLPSTARFEGLRRTTHLGEDRRHRMHLEEDHRHKAHLAKDAHRSSVSSTNRIGHLLQL